MFFLLDLYKFSVHKPVSHTLPGKFFIQAMGSVQDISQMSGSLCKEAQIWATSQ